MKNKKHTNPDPGGERPQAESSEPDGKLEAFYGRTTGRSALLSFGWRPNADGQLTPPSELSGEKPKEELEGKG